MPPQGRGVDPREIVKGMASFSGLWVFKEDHTDVRVLGAIAKVAPHVVKLESVEAAIRDEWKDELKVASARKAHDRVRVRKVGADEGNPEKPYEFQLLKWWEMKEGLVIPAIPVKQEVPGWDGGYRPGRNPTFKKFSTRTMRPGGELRHLHQVHLVLAAVPGLLLRHHPDRPLRRQHGGVLRLRRLRGGLPGGRLRHHGEHSGRGGQRDAAPLFSLTEVGKGWRLPNMNRSRMKNLNTQMMPKDPRFTRLSAIWASVYLLAMAAAIVDTKRPRKASPQNGSTSLTK